MAQWGEMRLFVLPDGGAVTVLADVDTCTWGPLTPESNVHSLLVIDINTASSEVVENFMQKLREQFVGKPHQNWANAR